MNTCMCMAAWWMVPVFLILGFFGAPFFLWLLAILGTEYLLELDLTVMAITAAIGLIFAIPLIRQYLVSSVVLVAMKKLGMAPKISDTERQAIEAGTAWIEKEFFRGNPSIKKLMSEPMPKLSAEEQAFMDNQVETLCSMLDDWKIWQERKIPENAWAYIKKEKFLSMGIPKKYGGLEFSALAHSEVIKKVASKSFVTAIYIMVPNSLGPGELILHYGTDEQKNHYLPRLATGEEIPCFGLTEVSAGSDAGNVQSEGIVFKKNGELYIRLNWDKRYISLAMISTIIGLAFRLRDPEKLLGGDEDLGITCALIPSKAPGVTLDKRHDPLGVPFHNCPMHGRNVEIPLSAVVGGREGVGRGWRMLMECLAAGRGISFPAQMAGSSQLVSRFVIPYTTVREQFGVSINKFEGVQKPLAEVISFTYLLEALRVYTLSALHQGMKPAVVAAMSKYYSTEISRKIINHGMDVMGGSAISLGPKNKIASYYIAAPISITVEGANILTRTLMIFGQGSFRAHPFAFPMVDGIEKNNLKMFDRSFFGLIGHSVQNGFRSVLLSLTRGWLAHPFSFKRQSKYYRKISWASASFAFFTDVAMGTLGGSLKFKESLTGRFADVVSYLYIASAVLRKYEDEGEKKTDWPLVEHALDEAFLEIERAFQGIFANFSFPVLGQLLKYPGVWWSRINPIGSGATDDRVEKVMRTVLKNPEVLKNMTRGIYEPRAGQDHLKELEDAMALQAQVDPILKKLKKDRKLQPTNDERSKIENWRKVQTAVLQVDEYTDAEYHG